jgi:hypothetical protein
MNERWTALAKTLSLNRSSVASLAQEVGQRLAV